MSECGGWGGCSKTFCSALAHCKNLRKFGGNRQIWILNGYVDISATVTNIGNPQNANCTWSKGLLLYQRAWFSNVLFGRGALSKLSSYPDGNHRTSLAPRPRYHHQNVSQKMGKLNWGNGEVFCLFKKCKKVVFFCRVHATIICYVRLMVSRLRGRSIKLCFWRLWVFFFLRHCCSPNAWSAFFITALPIRT